MKFSTREDVEIPIDVAFEMLCDFDAFERAAMRRGADIQRKDALDEPGVGMQWQAKFEIRGKERDMLLQMTEFERPNVMGAFSKVSGLEVTGQLEFLALSRTRTRLSVMIDISPKTLSARLLVQSLKLAKTSLTKRFKQRVAEWGKGFEDRYNRGL